MYLARSANSELRQLFQRSFSFEDPSEPGLASENVGWIKLIVVAVAFSVSLKSRMIFLPFWCRLTQVVLEKRPLNGCLLVAVAVAW